MIQDSNEGKELKTKYWWHSTPTILSHFFLNDSVWVEIYENQLNQWWCKIV